MTPTFSLHFQTSHPQILCLPKNHSSHITPSIRLRIPEKYKPNMVIPTILMSSPIPFSLHSTNRSSPILPTSNSRIAPTRRTQIGQVTKSEKNQKAIGALFLGTGFALTTLLGPATAAELPLLGSSIELIEPSNALSLPTWAIHVSSVVERIIAMALVWQYGEKSGYESWKGLSWGMVPLLGGAFCACTWHFFYNSESLEVLVALQAALTVIGNGTMCVAAFRIYKSAKEGSEKL